MNEPSGKIFVDMGRMSTSEKSVEPPIDVDHLKDNPFLGRDVARAEEMAKERQKKMSPAGALGLPPLLDERRLKFGITDGAFKRQPLYDRVFLYQIPEFATPDGKFSDGSLIDVPGNVLDKMTQAAPRGILVAVGLAAFDTLGSNGVQLGDVVEFVRMTPWQIAVDKIAGKEESLLVMRAGDLVTSVDLSERLRSGECSMKYLPETRQHVLVDKTGDQWLPGVPFIAAEY